MYKQQIEQDLKNAVLDLGFVATDIVVSIPENPKFGDYSTNVALQLSKQKPSKNYQNPEEIANAILASFGRPQYLERVEVAGAGFINFFIKDESLWSVIPETSGIQSKMDSRFRGNDKGKARNDRVGKKILVEYASPNTHKVFHIGHLRNIITGETVSRLLNYQDNEVFRVTYTSDIGPAVAKAVWGVTKIPDEYHAAKKATLKEKAAFLGKAYILGVKAYEKDPKNKEAIDEINKGLYQKNSPLIKLWEETKKWSAAYFDYIYNRLRTEFDAYIWESEVETEGKKIVEENLGKVFIEDQGAIIFPGEKFARLPDGQGLHNRVFITSAGNPTYEAKELGVTFKEESLFPFDLAIHVVANEQSDYFKVVIKALEQIEKRLVGKKSHLPYGFVNLTTGKMSSRSGNIVSTEELIDQVKNTIVQTYPNLEVKSADQTVEKIAIGAIKFSFLKYSLNSDISFDIKQSVSLHGDSGPYLMYTYARIASLLGKTHLRHSGDERSEESRIKQKKDSGQARMTVLEPEEREVLRLMEYFEAVVEEATQKLAPNILCEYLLNLAKAFNLFYERYSVIGSDMETFRLALAKHTGEILKSGLYLLGIEVVERM